MNSITKTVILWLVIVLNAFFLWQVVKTGGNGPATPEISYSKFMVMVANGQVNSVQITGNAVRGFGTKDGIFRVISPQNQAAMLDALQQHGVDIWFRDAPEQVWPNWVLNLAPLVLIAALWYFMVRQMRRRRPGSDASPTYMPPQESKTRFGP
jgi:cell division protease FtsH